VKINKSETKSIYFILTMYYKSIHIFTEKNHLTLIGTNITIKMYLGHSELYTGMLFPASPYYE